MRRVNIFIYIWKREEKSDLGQRESVLASIALLRLHRSVRIYACIYTHACTRETRIVYRYRYREWRGSGGEGEGGK